MIGTTVLLPVQGSLKIVILPLPSSWCNISPLTLLIINISPLPLSITGKTLPSTITKSLPWFDCSSCCSVDSDSMYSRRRCSRWRLDDVRNAIIVLVLVLVLVLLCLMFKLRLYVEDKSYHCNTTTTTITITITTTYLCTANLLTWSQPSSWS